MQDVTRDQGEVSLLKDRLEEAYKEGARGIAELCGLSMEHLHTLSTSLYNELRYKRKDKSFAWPNDPTSTAELLRKQVRLPTAATSNLAKTGSAFTWHVC